VAKAEGRLVPGTRAEVVAAHTRRVVARRGDTVIVRNSQGLTLAAAGVDASNVPAGRVLPLPADPDASARALRAGLAARAGVNVGVLVTDTAGRAWRRGQTDIAVGAAGVVVAESYAGAVDGHGNPLVVTAPAVADELAGAAELAQGKLAGRPFAVLRGRADLVLPAGEDGPGAVDLVRTEDEDLFGFGAREAVVRALAGRAADRGAFGAPASPDDARAALVEVLGPGAVTEDGAAMRAVGEPAVLNALGFALGWDVEIETPGRVRFLPPTP
jgi:coenzyme F420-0:L-glutamate ligase/coenzyme F420-1:gamma-L-glutamate ligase